MDDSVVECAAVDEVLLRLPLPDQDVAIAQVVQGVLLICAAHAADQDHLLHARLLCSINLALLPQPVHLVQCMKRLYLGIIHHYDTEYRIKKSHVKRKRGDDARFREICNPAV